jgi:hypothetical protein
MFSLSPLSPGTLFDSENVPVTSLTVAGDAAYWVAGSQVTADNLADTTGGGSKVLLPSTPFAGVTVTDLAVSPASNTYLVGWTAPGYGWFVAQYPLTPAGAFTVFSNDSNPIHGLTIAGNTAYWIDGANVFSEQLDGTGKAILQSFTAGAVTLNDLAIDSVNQTYVLAASTAGIPPLLARYPLTPNASGAVFAFANSNIPAVTVAGDTLYWIDGQSVWSENLNGTNLTLQETLPSQFTPTDLAVSLSTPATTPEPHSEALLGGGLIVLGMVRRRGQGGVTHSR